MRIALVTPEPPGVGGIGSYTTTLARSLADRGHEPFVLAAGFDEASAQHPGVRVIPLGPLRPWTLPAGNGALGLSLQWLGWAERVARVVRAVHAARSLDLVEVPEWMAGALWLGGREPPPVVVRLHSHLTLVRRLNGLAMTLDARLAAHLERRAMLRAALRLANSHALAQEAARDMGLPPGSIESLPLAIDLERFHPEHDPHLRERLCLSPHAVLALFAGRLERRKGLETLLEALALTRHEELHLAIAGADTPLPSGATMRCELEAQARAAGVAHRLHWLGAVSSEALPALMAGADFFVAPSRYESFGLVYLEAMATGRAVIGCRSGGVPEIVRDGKDGLLVPPDDPLALARALVRLAEDPLGRAAMGVMGRDRVIEHFSAPVLARRTVERYRRLADQHLAWRFA